MIGKRTLSILLSVVLVVGLMPLPAYANSVAGETARNEPKGSIPFGSSPYMLNQKGVSPLVHSEQSQGGGSTATPSAQGDEGVIEEHGPAIALEPQQDVGQASAEQGQGSALSAQTSLISENVSGAWSLAKPSASDLRSAWKAIPKQPSGLDIFAMQNDNDTYTASTLTEDALDFSESYLNFIRYSAGLSEISLDDTLNASAAQGALVLAKLNEGLTHYPTTPSGVTDVQAKPGKYACATSNISYAGAAPSYPDALGAAIQGQMDDSSSESNLSSLGHRRWLLNPSTSTMGIGSAYVKDSPWNTFYSAIRAFSNTASTYYDASYGAVGQTGATDYDFIAWPASGAFANNVFDMGTPWSITLNPSQYQVPSASDLTVTVTRLSDGANWTMTGSDSTPSTSGKYLLVDKAGYGVSNCIIFNPGSSNIAEKTYEGKYYVGVNGLKTRAGADTSLFYTVDFIDASADDTDPPATDACTVTFDVGAADVDSIPVQTVRSGGIASSPADPVRDGYEFGGWYVDADCEAPYIFSTPVVADITLYAKWMKVDDPDLMDISFAVITFVNAEDEEEAAYPYTGEAIKPEILVELDGEELEEGTDYAVEYTGNVNVGTATVIVSGMGAYTGQAMASFRIVASEPENWDNDIALDEVVDVAITSEDRASGVTGRYFKFVPERSGTYVISSQDCEGDPYVRLYGGDKWVLDENDDGGDGCNFSLTYDLDGGETYYIQATFLSEGVGSYQMAITKLPDVAGFSLKVRDGAQPLVIGDDESGQWESRYVEDEETGDEEEVEYFNFHLDAITGVLVATAQFDDGTVKKVSLYDIPDFEYKCDTWVAGGSDNTVTATYRGKTATVSIPVIDFAGLAESAPELALNLPVDTGLSDDSPVRYFWYRPVASGMHRFFTESDEGYVYEALYDAKGTRLADGARAEDGRNLSLTYSLDSDETYFLKLRGNSPSRVGVEKLPDVVSFDVSLKDDATPLVLGDSASGYLDDYYDEDTSEYIHYFRFYDDRIRSLLDITATLDDGTTGEFPYIDRAQISYDCKTWSVDGENLVTVTFDGVSKSVSIPVASFAEMYSSEPKLEEDAPQDVSYTGESDYAVVTFTPSEDGKYHFYSEGGADTTATLYDENGNVVVSNDDGYDGSNFLITVELKGGHAYVLKIRTYDGSPADYKVVVTRKAIEGGYTTLEGVDLTGKYINLALVVDTTGSMSPYITNVRENLTEFVTAISKTGATLRISLIDYRDIDPSVDGPDSTNVHHSPTTESVWFENSELAKLIEEIQALGATGGGDEPESAVDALANLVEPDIMTFNSTAAKFAFLVTDASYKDTNNHGIQDMDELIGKLKDAGIVTSAITAKRYYANYSKLISETGGKLMNIEDNFSNSMGAFAASIAKKTESHAVDASVVAVTKIELGDDLVVPTGKVRNFVPVIVPDNATNRDVLWDVKDEKVASIIRVSENMLVIRGIKEGNTEIVARSKDGGYTASFELSVSDKCYSEDGKTLESCNIDDVIEEIGNVDSSLDTFVYYGDGDTTPSVPDEKQKTIYRSLKGSKKKMSYVYDDEIGDLNHRWTFAGSDITRPDIAVDLNVEIGISDEGVKNVVEESGYNKYKAIDFKHNGDLPGKAAVDLAVDLEDASDYSLFYYNDEGKLELVDDRVEVKDGIASFNITHCSTYVVAKQEDKTDPDPDPDPDPIKIAKPVATDFTYDGEVHAGVKTGEGYTLRGTTSTSVVGTYPVIAILEDGYQWRDGTTDQVSLVWEITPAKIAKPIATDYTYDGEIHTGVTAGEGYTLSGDVDSFSEGEHAVTVTLRSGYQWSDGTTDPLRLTWRIAPANDPDPDPDPDPQPIKVMKPAASNFTYDGEAHTGVPQGEGYTLVGTASASAVGTYPVIATLQDGYQWSDGTTASLRLVWSILPVQDSKQEVDSPVVNQPDITPPIENPVIGSVVTAPLVVSSSVTQSSNTMKVKTSSKTFKASKLKKKAKTVKAISVSGAQGSVTYKNASTKKALKKFKVNAGNGKITVPKGVKKGTYNVKIKVTAAGDATHLSTTKTVSVKIKIK